MTGFVLRVNWTTAPIGSAVRMAGIAIRFGKLVAGSPKQKLLPHFSEARTAIFAVKQVE